MAGAIIAFLYFLLLCLFPHFRGSMGNNNSTDQLGLLSFKSMLSSDPSCILASWNTSRHFCSWPGVVCGRRHPERVVALLMGSSNLSGHISPFLGNLSFLKELDLSGNQLVGRVPTELGQLARLQFLNVSANHLEGSIPMTLGECTKLNELDLSNNKFQGEIPNEIGTLVNLVLIDFGNNGLSGEIPRSLADLRSIKYLSLRSNRLFGEIPSSWGNLSNLNLLSVRFNMLSGPIPSSLGVLSSLSLLSFAGNNLSGLIPATLWNISSLTAVSFQENMFTGTIPPNAFYNVPRLQKLYMDTNQFYGPIPSSISNASDMIQVQLNMNFFNGVIPPEVGSLRKLKWLQLSDNSFQTKQPKDWEFLTTLTNCSQLQVLGLGSNKFMGTLPDSFSNLSSSLTDLFLDTNALSGSIPKDIGNLINLQTLYLDTNFFTGSLPPSLCMLKNLVELYIYYNNITGSIPLAIGNLTRLEHLALFENSFSGTIPSTLGNLTELSKLGLQRNYLTGLIPGAIFNIPGLSNILDLSHNLLEGSLPQEIGNLKNLDEFNAESNSLSGDIPTTIGECQLLRYLYLQNNTFNGSIPSVLSQMKGLEILDLSSNNFSGKIPKFLGNLPYLDYLNLSFNNFTGEVPNFGIFANSTAISIHGNGELCGGIPDLHLPTCSLQLPKMKHKFLVIPIVTFLVATLIILPLLCKLLIWHKKIKTKIPSTTPIQGHLLITYSQLVRATDGFSAANLLGSGSFGLVYKGELNGQEGESTILVAVKVLKLETPKALKSFTAECEVLRNMQHRNLVKIITICSSLDSRGNDFKAIVYDFMANGSLEGWLHPDTNDQVEQRYLSLLQRVSILIDVAFALDYLHCHGPEPVAHCDLKPSNILLDADMVAHVGDFGLAKILVDGCSIVQPSTSSMGFIGTIGYAAPEYGAGNVVSTKGDIYSYGVIVLEMVTGKRPADSTLGQGMSLREYVELSLHNSTMDIVDMSLFLCPENEIQDASDSSHEGRIDCLMSLLRLGLSCSEDVASSRISTGDIIKDLLAIKGDLL